MWIAADMTLGDPEGILSGGGGDHVLKLHIKNMMEEVCKGMIQVIFQCLCFSVMFYNDIENVFICILRIPRRACWVLRKPLSAP